MFYNIIIVLKLLYYYLIIKIMKENFSKNTYNEFLNYLINGNHTLSSQFAHNYLINNSSILNIYENIFKKALYEIGILWELNKISVATEHLASAIIETILNEFYSKIVSKNKLNKTVVVACTENEFHQIGIKMVSDIFEINGWNSHFLGLNTTTEDLIFYIKNIKPDILALSLSLNFNLPVLEKMIEKIRSQFPTLTILVGGQAFNYGGLDKILKFSNVVYKSDLLSTEEFIKNYN